MKNDINPQESQSRCYLCSNSSLQTKCPIGYFYSMKFTIRAGFKVYLPAMPNCLCGYSCSYINSNSYCSLMKIGSSPRFFSGKPQHCHDRNFVKNNNSNIGCSPICILSESFVESYVFLNKCHIRNVSHRISTLQNIQSVKFQIIN